MAVITSATNKLLKLKAKIRAVSGGTGASKTYSIVMILIDYAQVAKNEKIDIVSESYPHLEAGVMQDFKEIMKDRGYWDDDSWNQTAKIYTFGYGSYIKFTSMDKIGKAHGPRRDVLFLNECNYMNYEIVDQLITRTRKIVWMDWNPSEEFWFYEHYLGHRENLEFLGEGGTHPPLTYLDNEGLSQAEIEEILAHKHNANWWRVYGLGLRGEILGRIYTDWQMVDDIPHEARLERRGIDFGWKPDPVAVVDIYYLNGGYILDEIMYQLETSNRELGETIKNLPKTINVADSAEPKSIAEVKMYGVNIIPAKKGPDSVRHGIKAVQDLKISVTKRSLNLIKEYRNYLWDTDKDGNIIAGKPTLGNDHLLDAARYALETLIPVHRKREMIPPMPLSHQQKTNIAI
jgi:phage terminase large subunit